MSSVHFDPYHKWLGIPKAEQPPHHYRLLGIPVFEEDHQVIEGAADRQMTFLRKFQSGENAADATKLLNEISRARICLLKVDAKAAYDETLRAELNARDASATPQTLPLWQQPAVMGGVVAATVLVVALTLFLAPRSKPAENNAPNTSDKVETTDGKGSKEPDKSTADIADSNSKKSSSKKNSDSDQKVAKSSVTDADTKLDENFYGQGKKAPWPTLLDEDPKGKATSKKAKANPAPETPAKTAEAKADDKDLIDLLPRIDTARDVAEGQWESDQDGLQGRAPDSQSICRLNVPYRPAPQYDLRLTVERQLPNGAFLVGLPVQGQQCALVLDTGGRNSTSGLSQIDGKLAHQNETTYRSRVLPGGEAIAIICSVRRTGITVEVNGMLLINWKGTPSQLSAPGAVPFVDPQSIMLAMHGGSFKVTELKLKPIPNEGSTPSETPTTAATTTNTPDTLEGGLEVRKLPTPDDMAQQAAKKAIRNIFKLEYDAADKAMGRNLEPRISLARALFGKAQDTDDDPAACYVMLSEAAEYAAEAGQLALAWEVLQTMGERFNVTPLPLMEKAARLAKPFAKNLEEITALGGMYALLLDATIEANDFETAGKVAQEANTATRKITVLKDQFAAAGRRATLLREAYKLAKPAQDVLKANADDATANLTWGRYLCFYKRDWTTGLPFLAKAADPELAAIAKSDLMQHSDPAALEKLGDDWWATSDKEKEPLKTTIQERAIDAWQQAMFRSGDRSKQQAINTKIEKIFGSTKFFETTGSGQGVAVSGAEVNAGGFFTVEFWVRTTSSEGVLISKRHQRRESSIAIRLQRGRPVVGGDSSNGFEDAQSRNSINDGRWHHVAAVKNANRLTLFVDGKSVAQTTAADVYLSASPWKVGHADVWTINEPDAKFCRLRFSKEARYLVNFEPERDYTKDKGTIFVP